MMKRFILFGLGIATVLLFLEITFRVLPVSTATRSGYYVHPQIITYPPNACFIAATGWDLKNVQRNCANNDGFVARRDFVRDERAIALIGDSFVEANMLPPEKRLADQLEANLAGKPVYALGGPGSNLLDYAERALFAAERYGIRTFVFVLERGDIKQALCGSGNIHGPCLDAKTLDIRIERQAEAGALKRIARESAFAQYLFSQIRVDAGKLKAQLLPVTKPSTPKLGTQASPGANAVEQIVSTFQKKLAVIGPARFLFLIDADRAHLESGSYATDAVELQTLVSAIKTMNGIVIDPTEVFRTYVANTGRNLDVGPYDRHWNVEATRLLATLVATELKEVNRSSATKRME